MNKNMARSDTDSEAELLVIAPDHADKTVKSISNHSQSIDEHHIIDSHDLWTIARRGNKRSFAELNNPNIIRKIPSRKSCKTDYTRKFREILGEESAERCIKQFREYDTSLDKDDNLLADEIIKSLIFEYKMSNNMLKTVLRIGNNRFYRIKRNEVKKEPGGHNVNKVSDEMIQDLSAFMNSLDVAEVNHCPHRVRKYIIDPSLTTWLEVHERYMRYPCDDRRKMTYKTFHRWVRSVCPGLIP